MTGFAAHGIKKTSNNAVRAGKGSAGGTIKLQWTGQYVTYSPGDDGRMRVGVPPTFERWIDNGNGTITDSVTGLIWLRKAIGSTRLGRKQLRRSIRWAVGDAGSRTAPRRAVGECLTGTSCKACPTEWSPITWIFSTQLISPLTALSWVCPSSLTLM